MINFTSYIKHNTIWVYAGILFIIVFLLYLANLPDDYHRSLARQNHRRLITTLDAFPNTLVPYIVIKQRTLEFSGVMNVFETTQETRKTPYFLLKTGDYFVSKYPVFTGILAIPIYLIPLLLNKIPGFSYYSDIANILALGRVAASFYAALSVVLFFILIKKIDGIENRNTDNTWALIFTFFYAFGTTTYSISSRTLWQQTTAQFLATLAVLCLIYGIQNPKFIKWSGLFLSIAVLCRTSMVTLAIVIAIYIFVEHRKQVVSFLLFSLPALVFLTLYNYIFFGGLSVSGYEISGDVQFTGNILEGMLGLLFSPSRGIIFISPPLILFLIEIYRIIKTRFSKQVGQNVTFGIKKLVLLKFYLAIGFFVHFVLVSSWWCWWGGDSFGYRLLTEYLPIIGLFAYEVTVGWNKRIKFIVAVFMCYSIFLHANSVLYYVSRCEEPNNWSFTCITQGTVLSKLK